MCCRPVVFVPIYILLFLLWISFCVAGCSGNNKLVRMHVMFIQFIMIWVIIFSFMHAYKLDGAYCHIFVSGCLCVFVCLTFLFCCFLVSWTANVFLWSLTRFGVDRPVDKLDMDSDFIPSVHHQRSTVGHTEHWLLLRVHTVS